MDFVCFVDAATSPLGSFLRSTLSAHLHLWVLFNPSSANEFLASNLLGSHWCSPILLYRGWPLNVKQTLNKLVPPLEVSQREILLTRKQPIKDFDKHRKLQSPQFGNQKLKLEINSKPTQLSHTRWASSNCWHRSPVFKFIQILPRYSLGARKHHKNRSNGTEWRDERRTARGQQQFNGGVELEFFNIWVKLFWFNTRDSLREVHCEKFYLRLSNWDVL